jgi:hypothetical protein
MNVVITATFDTSGVMAVGFIDARTPGTGNADTRPRHDHADRCAP